MLLGLVAGALLILLLSAYDQAPVLYLSLVAPVWFTAAVAVKGPSTW